MWAVVNSTAFMNPPGQYSLESDGPDGPRPYIHRQHRSGSTDRLFVSEYVNLIEAATVIDEGGNNINMRFTPLAGDPMVLASDYHIAAGSPAVDSGAAATHPLLALDFDDEARPSGAGVDVGADEYPAAAPPPCPADLNGDGCSQFFSTSGQLSGQFRNQLVRPRLQPCPGDINGDGAW